MRNDLVNTNGITEYWERLDKLIRDNGIAIDRKKGSMHPRYESIVYPIDYGYIKNTTSMDNGGIDVFYGNKGDNNIQGILCTIDILKKDSEIKVLYNCTEEEIEIARKFMESEYMSCLLIMKP
jgi:inorganic pyrophosphatase